ncbi:7702_t:CDS:10 [Entrophospora sp. SA101]|nr:7702_t:CDS:10 [Entrophospora sp. SA101]
MEKLDIIIGQLSKVLSEQPSITISLTSIKDPTAPAVHLGFGKDFNISCLLYYDYAGKNSTNCDQYVIQPKKIGYEDYPYVGYFSPKGNINLTQYYIDSGPYFVYLYVNIKDSTDDFTQEFRMTVYDEGNEYDMQNQSFVAPTSPFEKSLFYMNKHTLVGRNKYKLGYSRRTRETLITTFLTYFGTPIPVYNTTHYIETSMQAVPASPSNTNYATIRISPQNFIIADEQEQRSNTIISTLGTIAVYHRVDSMKPWGFVHHGCCGCCGFRRKAEIGIERSLAEENIESSTILSERMKKLEDFKIILEKYVVDTSLLETIKQRQEELDKEFGITARTSQNEGFNRIKLVYTSKLIDYSVSYQTRHAEGVIEMFSDFHDGQKDAILSFVQNHDTLVLKQTGGDISYDNRDCCTQPVNYNFQQKVFRVDQQSLVFSEGPEVLNHVRYFSKYCKQILVNYFSWQGDPMPEEVIDAIIKVKQQQVNRNDVVDVFR